MEFILNKEGILSSLTNDQLVTLGESPVDWQTPGDVTVAFDNVLPPEGLPFSFVERPDGHTDAIYGIEDMRQFVIDAPLGSVYYLQPDLVNKEISLWVKKEDGWHPGVIELKHNSGHRRMNEPTKMSSSDLFEIIKGTNDNRESFVLLYQFRIEDKVELREKEITSYQELVDIIFNQNVLTIKYFLARYHHISTVAYSRIDHDSWKRLI